MKIASFSANISLVPLMGAVEHLDAFFAQARSQRDRKIRIGRRRIDQDLPFAPALEKLERIRDDIFHNMRIGKRQHDHVDFGRDRVRRWGLARPELHERVHFRGVGVVHRHRMARREQMLRERASHESDPDYGDPSAHRVFLLGSSQIIARITPAYSRPSPYHGLTKRAPIDCNEPIRDTHERDT
jgi:hypothetical protein